MQAVGKIQKVRSLVLRVDRFEVRPGGAAFKFEMVGPVCLTVPEGCRVPASDEEAARWVCAHIVGSVLYGESFAGENADWMAAKVRTLSAYSLQRLEFPQAEAVGWVSAALYSSWEDPKGGAYLVAVRLLPESELPGVEGLRLQYVWSWRVSLPYGFTVEALPAEAGFS